MNIDTLNILAEAISDVGSWQRWLIRDDMVQVQFCDIMLYDENTPENEPHSTDALAVRFIGNAFAVFLDDLKEENWYERLREDDPVIYPVDTYDMVFDDVREVNISRAIHTRSRKITPSRHSGKRNTSYRIRVPGKNRK